jgi:MFS family permease
LSNPVNVLPRGLAAATVVAAGIAAAVQVGKLPPAMPALREHFGMSLVQVSLLVSAFQLAGMSLGIVGGMLADRFGPRRVMLAGLTLLALAGLSALAAPDARWLLVTRAIESAGFILTVLPGPVLLRRVVEPARISVWLGYWGAYMPAGMGVALFAGPWLIGLGGWSWLWVFAAVVALAIAWPLARLLAPDPPSAQAEPRAMWPLIRDTARAPGPWLLAFAFGCYAAQWMGVFSFLPTIYQSAGVDAARAGWLTAVAASVNLLGNVAGGRLAHWRVPPPLVLATAGLCMAATAWIAFGADVAFTTRYLAIVGFSMLGGLTPGTLFSIAPRLAPHGGAVSTTVGLMQQGSAIGQFVSPPVLAAMASSGAEWSHTWMATGVFALGNVLAAALLGALLRTR